MAAAGKSLTALLADLEEREQLTRFVSAGDRYLDGVIVAGNREVCWVKEQGSGKVVYVILSGLFYVEEL